MSYLDLGCRPAAHARPSKNFGVFLQGTALRTSITISALHCLPNVIGTLYIIVFQARGDVIVTNLYLCSHTL